MNQHLLPSSLPDLSGAGAAGPDGLQRQSLLRIWYAFRLRWWVPLTVTGLALALLGVGSYFLYARRQMADRAARENG